MKLEAIAQQMFRDFVHRRTGMSLDWRYLSPERKLQWMREVSDTFNECLDYLNKDLKPYLQPTNSMVSYERGFVAGQAQEARRLQEKIEYMKHDITDQLERFKEINAKSQENS